MVDASSIELFLESIKSVSTISRELLGLMKGGAASDKIGKMNAKIMEAQQFALATQSDQFSLSKCPSGDFVSRTNRLGAVAS